MKHLLKNSHLPNPPVEPAEVVPEAASLNGAVEEKSEGKESTPLDSLWGFPSGETFIDEKAANEIRGRRDQQMVRLSESIALQLGAYFQRQKRVVLEKWKSKKVREKVNKGISISVNDILDVPEACCSP